VTTATSLLFSNVRGADDDEGFADDDAKNLEMQRPLPALITDRVAVVVAAAVVVVVAVDFFPPDVVTAATETVAVDLLAGGVGPGSAGCRPPSSEMTVAARSSLWGALVTDPQDDCDWAVTVTTVVGTTAVVAAELLPGALAIAFSGVMKVTS
jgi:hypothetical protein